MADYVPIDLDRYVLSRVAIANGQGGRGHDTGTRVYDCMLCGDSRARGWINIHSWHVGCFNSGCIANPRLEGDAIEWVRRLEGFLTRGRAYTLLRTEFAGVSAARPAAPRSTEVFCRLPPSDPLVTSTVVGKEASAFLQRQWSVSLSTLQQAGLRSCMTGRHAWRAVIPIAQAGTVVTFQSRTFRHAEPKYLAAKAGPATDPASECGTPIGEVLYRVDAVRPGASVVLVEGPGDVLALVERSDASVPVGLLGTALTPHRLALLTSLAPAEVIVALDAEPEAQARARHHVEDLVAWGLPALVATWTEGKDAGSGGRLTVTADARTLTGRAAARLGPLKGL